MILLYKHCTVASVVSHLTLNPPSPLGSSSCCGQLRCTDGSLRFNKSSGSWSSCLRFNNISGSFWREAPLQEYISTLCKIHSVAYTFSSLIVQLVLHSVGLALPLPTCLCCEQTCTCLSYLSVLRVDTHLSVLPVCAASRHAPFCLTCLCCEQTCTFLSYLSVLRVDTYLSVLRIHVYLFVLRVHTHLFFLADGSSREGLVQHLHIRVLGQVVEAAQVTDEPLQLLEQLHNPAERTQSVSLTP